MEQQEKPLMKADELAQLFNISKARAYDLARREALPGVVRLGRSIRFNRAMVMEYISGGRVQASQ